MSSWLATFRSLWAGSKKVIVLTLALVFAAIVIYVQLLDPVAKKKRELQVEELSGQLKERQWENEFAAEKEAAGDRDKERESQLELKIKLAQEEIRKVERRIIQLDASKTIEAEKGKLELKLAKEELAKAEIRYLRLQRIKQLEDKAAAHKEADAAPDSDDSATDQDDTTAPDATTSSLRRLEPGRDVT